ncbi:alpha/beta hydrolase [Lentzea sp. BCCO 10_0856]|uniref:Alpha/beta hydrolase n=1 Tax=Lentzea miocenica TaxID=3095431 RepID=A0ABU4T4I9_9PSEU|nr:alpha/beta hydrolase [Lentzea sp. BCCO 10_0856]MDX8033091.1 alpha/beta hydrolase [Lentzea sp. BCCO 10_0856]
MADSLVLLHPGGADPSAFGPQFDALADFALHAPHRVDQATQDHTEMARDTIAFLEKTGPAHLLGCSDGATVALLTAVLRPDLVQRLVVVCGVFHHNGWDPATELTPMHRRSPALTEQDLAKLNNRTLVMIGDDDEVTLEHATAMYRALPNAELAVVPGTSHGLLHEKPALCNAMIVDFLTNEPVETYAPIRRRM